jgi:hypothetical protein
MKSQNYQGILERNVLPSVRKLWLSSRSWVLQQDNDAKHTAKTHPRMDENKILDYSEVAFDES